MKKHDILSPRRAAGDPDRFLECQEALEIAFQNTVERAVKAGWTEGEACAAVIELADHHVLGLIENEHISRSINAFLTGK